MDDQEELRTQAIDAILRQIAVEVAQSRPNSGKLVRNLAEAYAWLIDPGQPHGGACDG